MSASLLPYARSVSGRVVYSLQNALALYQLRRRIDRLLTLAEDHQASGVPNGDARLVQLHKQALEEIDCYCTRWDHGRECLIAELPALSRLERLAEMKSSSAAGVLLASFTGAVLVGLALGLCHLAYRLIAHLAQ